LHGGFGTALQLVMVCWEVGGLIPVIRTASG